MQAMNPIKTMNSGVHPAVCVLPFSLSGCDPVLCRAITLKKKTAETAESLCAAFLVSDSIKVSVRKAWGIKPCSLGVTADPQSCDCWLLQSKTLNAGGELLL